MHPMPNRWAIIDDNSVIDEGTEDEIRSLWADFDRRGVPWTGDLKLVEIHDVIR